MAVEQTGKVKLKFSADTKQARREIDKLDRKQRETAKSAIKANQDQSKAIEGQIAMFSKLALGVGAAVGAVKALQAAAKNFAKEAQLQQAAKGFDVSKIQAASKGLISQYEALQFAAAAANTDFKISQTDMENAAKAMVSLRNQGNDLETVIDGVTKSVVEGNVRALRPFGVMLEGTSGKVSGFTSAMERLTVEAGRSQATMSLAGDDMIVAGNEFDDAMRNMSLALGELAVELAPVVKLLAGLVNLVTKLGNLELPPWLKGQGGLLDLPPPMVKTRLGSIPKSVASALGRFSIEKQKERDAAAQALREKAIAALDPKDALFPKILTGIQKTLGKGRGKGRGMGRVSSSLAGGRVAALPRGLEGPGLQVDAFEEGPGFLGTGTGELGGQGDFFAGLDAQQDAQVAKAEQMRAAAAETAAALAEIITPMQLLEDIGTSALSAFSGAAAEAFEALITGSKSAGEAFTEFFGKALLGMAKQLAGLAVSEGVMALVDLARGLATGDAKMFASAAKHGEAAAAAGAGALVVGAIASTMGVGGVGAVTTAPPGAAGAVGAAGAGAGNRDITVYVGSDFEDNARANADRLTRAFTRARQQEGDDSVVVFQ